MREISYTCPATSFVKKYTNFEKQWLCALGSDVIAIRTSSSTPEVPGGNSFTTELLYIIRDIAKGTKSSSSHLEVTAEISFHKGQKGFLLPFALVFLIVITSCSSIILMYVV